MTLMIISIKTRFQNYLRNMQMCKPGEFLFCSFETKSHYVAWLAWSFLCKLG